MNDLNNTQAGDVLALQPPYGARPILVKVVSVTATQILLDGNQRFRKKDGFLVGATGYGRSYLDDRPHAILSARRNHLETALSKGAKATQSDIGKLRALADRAEAFLREVGEWDATS